MDFDQTELNYLEQMEAVQVPPLLEKSNTILVELSEIERSSSMTSLRLLPCPGQFSLWIPIVDGVCIH